MKRLSLGWWALFLSLAFTVENWIFGPASWIYGYGSGLETIPAFLGLSHGYGSAAWAPFAAGGVDRLAFWGNADLLSPETLLFSTCPVWIANAIHRTLQYWVGIYFTARLLIDGFKVDRRFALAGGTLFGCFSYFTVGALFTLPGVPFLIWAVERLLKEKRGAGYFMGLGAVMSLATTFIFGVPYLVSFAFAWLVIVRFDLRFSTLWRVGLFALTLGLLELPQLLAVGANAAESHRAHWAIEPLSLSWNGLFYRQLQFDLFAQDKLLSFITCNLPLPLLLVCAAIMLRYRRNNVEADALVRPFLRVAGLFLLFSQKWLFLTVQSVAATLLPWAGGIYMGRFFEIPASFLLAIAATLAGRWMWLTLPSPSIRKYLTIAFIVFAVFMIVEPKRHLFQTLGIADWGQANYQVASIETLKQQTKHPFRVASVLPLQPAYAYAQGLETADGWANIYTHYYRELWLKVLEPLYTEIPADRAFFGVDSGKAVDNFIFLGKDTELLSGETEQSILKNGFDLDRRFRLNLLRLLNVEYLLSEYKLHGKGVTLIHVPEPAPTKLEPRDPNTGLTAGNPVKHHLWRAFMNANARKLAGKDVFIYRLDAVVPRVHLVQHLQQYATADDALNAMTKLANDQLHTTAVVEDGVALPHRFSTGEITHNASVKDRRTLDIVLNQPLPGFVVFAESWNPFWQASVDGKPVAIIRTNHAQMGILLPPGKHNVELAYRPFYSDFY